MKQYVTDVLQKEIKKNKSCAPTKVCNLLFGKLNRLEYSP